MKQFRALALVAALTLALTTPGCRLFRRSSKTIPPPPPPPPPVETAAPLPQPAAPPNLPTPPPISPEEPDLSHRPPSEPAVVQLPPPPRPRPRNRKEPAENQAPAEAEANNPPPTVPQLEPILTPQQRQAYLESIDSNISRAQHTIDLLQGRRLDSEQKLTLERVRAFLQQAAEARKSDLFRAKNLAERATVMAEDLLRSVQ